MSGLTIGSLFSGYAGLDSAVQQVIEAETVWFCEFDPAPSKVLAHRWPDIPNFGDITKVDWSTVEPVDILTGGFPCTDVSLAGARAGLNADTRSGLWSEFAKAIDVLGPSLVVIENVRGLLSARTVDEVEETGDMEWGTGSVGDTSWERGSVLNAFGRVLGDLAGLGYDTEWCGLRAADAGAPHGRFRVFIVARPYSTHGDGGGWEVGGQGAAGFRAGVGESARDFGAIGGTTAADTRGVGLQEGRLPSGQVEEIAKPAHDFGILSGTHGHIEWGVYAPAIERWQSVLGRVAPSPTMPDGRNEAHRLSPQFVEWLMGLPAGHVTDPAIGLTRNQQLKILGNGVVPQQAALALSILLQREQVAA